MRTGVATPMAAGRGVRRREDTQRTQQKKKNEKSVKNNKHPSAYLMHTQIYNSRHQTEKRVEMVSHDQQ
jgi:hypothetical protein